MPSFSRASLVRFAVPVNKRMAALTASPRWGRLVGRKIVLLTYTGRRSGRTFTIPVGYRRDGDRITIGVRMPEAKTWWRNFLGEGAPLSLHLDGTDRTGHAISHRDDQGRVTVAVILDR
ncbi:nitroreductase/quinone reductase family protein [Actinoplanes sp. NPDC004185]